MTKFISIFNNKGGVGKTNLTWNIADSIARKGKTVLTIDFDPQCNLSIAILGDHKFKSLVGNSGNSRTIRSFLQGYMQNTGPGIVETHRGIQTHENVRLVAGDFWLNVYADSLSVGNDLLTGNGLAKFVAIRTIEETLSKSEGKSDYVLIDLPPSFGGLVRSALYSSDYLIIPCTSDTFSEYCISLIAQMLPQFISDWDIGLQRYKQNNYGSKEYDGFGKPKYAGWIFNGYDTRSGKILRADNAHFHNIVNANASLIASLRNDIEKYDPIHNNISNDYTIGRVEDMNVLIQNSLWQNIPAARLSLFKQVSDLSGNKSAWSESQRTLINEVAKQINQLADNFISRL